MNVIDTLLPTRRTPLEDRLLPADLRRPAAAAAAGCAALLVLLAVIVAGTATATPFDTWVEQVIASHHVLRGQGPSLAIVAGEPVTVVVVAFLASAWCASGRRWRSAALMVLGPGLTGLAETILKPVLGRTIHIGALAFPSGHTAGATALGLALTLVIAGYVRQRRELWILVGVLLSASGAAVVAVGLVAERAHYPTDTIGGFCLALTMTVATAAGIDRVARVRGRAPATRQRADAGAIVGTDRPETSCRSTRRSDGSV